MSDEVRRMTLQEKVLEAIVGELKIECERVTNKHIDNALKEMKEIRDGIIARVLARVGAVTSDYFHNSTVQISISIPDLDRLR